jgi:hypothetical protein
VGEDVILVPAKEKQDLNFVDDGFGGLGGHDAYLRIPPTSRLD